MFKRKTSYLVSTYQENRIVGHFCLNNGVLTHIQMTTEAANLKLRRVLSDIQYSSGGGGGGGGAGGGMS